jgi:hypothetical protein
VLECGSSASRPKRRTARQAYGRRQECMNCTWMGWTTRPYEEPLTRTPMLVRPRPTRRSVRCMRATDRAICARDREMRRDESCPARGGSSERCTGVGSTQIPGRTDPRPTISPASLMTSVWVDGFKACVEEHKGRIDSPPKSGRPRLGRGLPLAQVVYLLAGNPRHTLYRSRS